MEKELEQTQIRLSTASQELHSVKATAQQAQREREQVTDKIERENVFDVSIDNYRSLTTLLMLVCSGENTADK